MLALWVSQVLRIENGQEVDLSCISGLHTTAYAGEEPLAGMPQTACHHPHGPADLTLEVCSDEVHIELTTGTRSTASLHSLARVHHKQPRSNVSSWA